MDIAMGLTAAALILGAASCAGACLRGKLLSWGAAALSSLSLWLLGCYQGEAVGMRAAACALVAAMLCGMLAAVRFAGAADRIRGAELVGPASVLLSLGLYLRAVEQSATGVSAALFLLLGLLAGSMWHAARGRRLRTFPPVGPVCAAVGAGLLLWGVMAPHVSALEAAAEVLRYLGMPFAPGYPATLLFVIAAACPGDDGQPGWRRRDAVVSALSSIGALLLMCLGWFNLLVIYVLCLVAIGFAGGERSVAIVRWPAVASVACLLMGVLWRSEKLESWYGALSDPWGIGFQWHEAGRLLAAAPAVGRGALPPSTVWLPDAEYTFVLVEVAQAFGWAGLLLAALCIGCLAWCAVRSLRGAAGTTRRLGAAAGAFLFVPCALNVAYTLHLLPLPSVSLFPLSRGATPTVCWVAALLALLACTVRAEGSRAAGSCLLAPIEGAAAAGSCPTAEVL